MHEKNKNLITPEGYNLKFRERESVEIKLDVPKTVLKSLEEIAVKKNLSVESVLKFFIGQGLRNESGAKPFKKFSSQESKAEKSSQTKTDIDLAA